MKAGWGDWGCSTWRWEGFGKTLKQIPHYLKWGHRKFGKGLLTSMCCDRARGVALSWKWVYLDHISGRNSLLWGWWNTGNGYPEKLWISCCHQKLENRLSNQTVRSESWYYFIQHWSTWGSLYPICTPIVRTFNYLCILAYKGISVHWN